MKMFRFPREKYKLSVFIKFCAGLILCFHFTGSAQDFYSARPDYLKSKTEHNNLLSAYKNVYPDTTVTELHNFFPRNFLGNTGLPSPDYIFTYGADDPGFRFLHIAQDNDRFRENKVAYFRSAGPFAQLTGVSGSNELQIFKMLFTHTYKDKVNISVQFNRYTSKGFYVKQQTYTNNVFLTSNYTSKNKRGGYYFFILNNGNKNQDNGGIRNRVLNDSTMLLNKELFRVNLSSASRDNRETKAMINPWLRLNKKNDSLGNIGHYLQIKSGFSDNSYRYKDLGMRADNFYNLVYLDTLRTLDSAHVRQFSNEINYVASSANNKSGFSAGYKNEVNQVWQKTDSSFMNHIARADFVYRKEMSRQDSLHNTKQGIENRLNIQYVFKGASLGNYKVENNAVFIFNENKKRSVFFDMLFEKRNPDFIYNNWTSNHFQWFNNKFKAQQQTQLRTGLNLGQNFKVSLFYRNIFNYLYFDNDALPRQYAKTIANIGASLAFTKILFKHLGVSLEHIFQNTSHPGYVRAPSGISTAKLFYYGNFFRKNLQLQIGSQAQVYQSFFASAYMPATQVFYLQENFQTAAYPYVDLFLNARIRPVSFFLKVENVLQGFVGNNYALVPGYYQPDRAFRFGISWMFFD